MTVISHPYPISYAKHLASAVPADKAPTRLGEYCWPSPNGPVDIFGCEWPNAFGSAPSLQTCYDETVEWLKEEGVVITEAVLEDILCTMLERLEEGICEHGVPWYSRGIKRELKKLGVAVTKADDLDEYFSCINEFDEAKRLVAEFGVREAARKAADCEVFDSHYTGNLCGFKPHEIIASWKRLGIC